MRRDSNRAIAVDSEGHELRIGDNVKEVDGEVCSFPVLPLPSTFMADKLFAILSNASREGRPIHTLGAIDPVQMTQMARYLQAVYISGWAASSVLTTGNNEVGPDFG